MRNRKRHNATSVFGAGSAVGYLSAAVLLLLMTFPLSAPASTLRAPTSFSPIDGSSIGPKFAGDRSVAVDETTGNIFVPRMKTVGGFGSEPGPSAVYILDSEGGIPAGVASPYKILFSSERQLEFGAAVAVDNSVTSPARGTLYLVNDGSHKVEKFVRNPGTELYEAAGELNAVPPFQGLPESAVTVDADGNVYVTVPFETGGGFGTITKFSPSGAQLEQIKATEATRRPKGLAVDSAGDLFVLTQLNKVFKYPVNGLGELEDSNFVEIPFSDPVLGIGIDRASNTLFAGVNVQPAGAGQVAEFDATTLAEKGTFGEGLFPPGGGAPFGITVNTTLGVIYLAEGGLEVLAFNLHGATLPNVGATAPSGITATHVVLNGIVNPLGVPISECKFELRDADESAPPMVQPCEGALPTDSSDHAVSAEFSGLAVKERYRYRLVVASANGVAHSLSKKVTTAAIAETTPASAITASGATLNGSVRPEGSPLTECKFEYGLTSTYGTTVPCNPEAAAIPADFAPHAVSAEVSGLVVGTTYHYRVVASGGLGSEAGEDKSFTVLGPTVEGTFFSLLTEDSATLEAAINPRGKATSFHFEYGSQGPCSANPCTSTAEAPVGSGEGTVEVAQPIAGLSPKTTYRFRVVVTNPDGTGQGAESSFTTYESPSGFPPCPDESFRAGLPSARLPDCRVYEQASPVAKNGNDAYGGNIFQVQASEAGDGITSQVYGGLPGGEGAEVYPTYLSQRGPEGWSTQGLLPPPSYGEKVLMSGWTPDLAYSFASVAAADSGDDPSGEYDRSYLVRSSATQQIQQATPYVNAGRYAFAGSSADDSKLFFEAEGKNVNLTGNAATSKDNLYLYEPGSEELSLIGVLPGGTAPPGGSFAGPFDWWSKTSPVSLLEGGALGKSTDYTGHLGYYLQRMHAISRDGSRAFFTAGATGQIYLRQGIGSEEPKTVPVSASQRTTPDPNGEKPAIFAGATPDGSKAFFTSCQKLTDDSTAHSSAANACDTPEQGQDLYAYDVAGEGLEDLTLDSEDPQGAEVIGFLGNSEDGSVAYFVANGDLDGPGGPAEAGNCIHTAPSANFSGSCNLYAWSAGTTTYVARLDALHDDSANWIPRGDESNGAPIPESRVSADGQSLVFRSARQLTAYDSHIRSGECDGRRTCAEFYRYRLGDAGPTCVSCNPTGAPPIGAPRIDSFSSPISIPAGHPIAKRFVSSSGEQVFFETPDKLVAADVNGDHGCKNEPAPPDPCQDVYEWEAPGAGSCTEQSPAYVDLDAGCLYLLSTGTSETASYFGDASVSGRDVFIFTRSRLVPTDSDGQSDIYDVRVEGGLASQNPPPPAPPCEGDACRSGSTSPPSVPSAGSAGFQGPANPTPKRCSKGKVKKGGKCVKPKPKKHHHKHKHRSQQRAGANRGGAR